MIERVDKKILFLVDYKIKFSYEIPENFPESLLYVKNKEVSLTKTEYNKRFVLDKKLSFSENTSEHYRIHKLRNAFRIDLSSEYQKIVKDYMHKNFTLSKREQENLEEDYAFILSVNHIYDKTNDKLLYESKTIDEVIDNIHTRTIVLKHHSHDLTKFD